MMGGIIDKLFFRIHFSLNFELGIHNTNKVLLSIIWTFDQYLILIDFFCHCNETKMLLLLLLSFGTNTTVCVHIYLGRWNQSSNAKQICTHRRSYLKYASNFESEVWKEFKCVLTLLCIQTKRGEKKCILVLPKLTNMIFFVKEDWGMKGKMFVYICNTKTKPISVGMLYKPILIR